MRYKGKYRIMSHIDKNTNDYPRDLNGNIEQNDAYIKCEKGNQIYHYGRSTLVAYIPSIGRGHNILFAIAKDLCGLENRIDYEKLYELLEQEGTIKNISENDKEIEFMFNSKDIEFIAKFLKPQVSGSNISPYSTRNLPKKKYTIPNDDLLEYKKITESISKDNILLISQIAKRFFSDYLAKKPLYKRKDFNKDMKLKMLKGKEYIHSEGLWSEYLKYLQKEINNINE